MMKEELKNNKVLRYPEEYQVYDEEEEARRKLQETTKRVKLTAAEKAAEKKKKQDQRRMQIEQLKRNSQFNVQEEREIRRQKAADKALIDRRITEAILFYLSLKNKHLVESSGTLRNYIAEHL